MKSGETNYVNPASGKNRWGDYSGAVVDPADPSKLWLFGEYAASTTNNWGTWAGQVAITGGGTGPCVAGANTLCLNNSRFRVTASFQSPAGSGTATAVPLTGDTGYFWFFSANNVEVVIKVVDGRAVNNRFWVFAGGLTNVNVIITVTDTQTGATQTYINPQGIAFQPIQDTGAFAGSRVAGGDGSAGAASRSVAASAEAISAGLTRLLERGPAAPAASLRGQRDDPLLEQRALQRPHGLDHRQRNRLRPGGRSHREATPATSGSSPRTTSRWSPRS